MSVQFVYQEPVDRPIKEVRLIDGYGDTLVVSRVLSPGLNYEYVIDACQDEGRDSSTASISLTSEDARALARAILKMEGQ